MSLFVIYLIPNIGRGHLSWWSSRVHFRGRFYQVSCSTMDSGNIEKMIFFFQTDQESYLGIINIDLREKKKLKIFEKFFWQKISEIFSIFFFFPFKGEFFFFSLKSKNEKFLEMQLAFFFQLRYSFSALCPISIDTWTQHPRSTQVILDQILVEKSLTQNHDISFLRFSPGGPKWHL